MKTKGLEERSSLVAKHSQQGDKRNPTQLAVFIGYFLKLSPQLAKAMESTQSLTKVSQKGTERNETRFLEESLLTY